MLYGPRYLVFGRQLRPSDFSATVRARYGRKPPRKPRVPVVKVRDSRLDAERDAQLSQLSRDTAAATVYVKAGDYSDSHQ